MTVAQQTDVRSMYPRGEGQDRRVPRPLGWRAVLAVATLAAAVPAVLWAASVPLVGAAVVAAVAVAVTGTRRVPARRTRRSGGLRGTPDGPGGPE